jgi:hypothetical protein
LSEPSRQHQERRPELRIKWVDPCLQLSDEGSGVHRAAAQRQRHGTGDGDTASRTARVLVGYAALLASHVNQLCGLVEEQEAYGARAHYAAIASARRRRPSVLPGDAFL